MSKDSMSSYSQADADVVDRFGRIDPLHPKLLARAERVVRRFADPAATEELLDILGLTEGASA